MTPERKQQLEDLRDAIQAHLDGKLVETRDLLQTSSPWVITYPNFTNMRDLHYRPAPEMVKLHYRLCVLRQGNGAFRIDVVCKEGVETSAMFRDSEVMQNRGDFVRWLDDDWVVVEVPK